MQARQGCEVEASQRSTCKDTRALASQMKLGPPEDKLGSGAYMYVSHPAVLI